MKANILPANTSLIVHGKTLVLSDDFFPLAYSINKHSKRCTSNGFKRKGTTLVYRFKRRTIGTKRKPTF
ncbi:MAG: hypothetical protein V9E96_19600 [Chitinophagaceae bacterium]